MENVTIAKLISIFETSTLTLVIILAIAGIAMLIMRARSGDTSNTSANNNANNATPPKVNRAARIMQNAFIRALCIAALVAFLPELTYFNHAYYLRYFAGDEIATTTKTIGPDNQQMMRLTNGGVAEIFQIYAEGTGFGGIGLRFNNLNEIVTSIHIDAEHKYTNAVNLQVKWRDEEGTSYTFHKQLFNGLPHNYYIPLQPRGKFSQLELSFVVELGVDARIDVNLNQVTLNKPIPFYLSGLRLLVLTFILFVIIAIANKETRSKLSYALFQYKFDANNKKQSWAYIATVFLILIFSWLNIYTGLNLRIQQNYQPQHQIYNVYLVDALIAKRTWLDYGNPEKILEWEDPYNHNWRNANEKRKNIDWMFEWGWYKGKYYSPFGVVPAVILHVPYKLITGQHLSNHGSIFIFCAIAVVVLALLWRYCVIKWMPNARFAFFMLGFLTLYFTASLHVLFVFARHHSIMQASGLMFAITGCYLLLKSIDKEKTNYILLFFACFSFALIAGCRPSMAFISIIVPFVLWKRRSWKLVAFILLPYILAAIPLMWYNYIRFESVTDFGYGYFFGDAIASSKHLSPIGKFMMKFDDFMRYLLLPAKYSLEFPYVTTIMPAVQSSVTHGILITPYERYGLINYPIVLFLLYMFNRSFRKNALQEKLPMLYGFLAAAVTTMLISVNFHPAHSRYLPDFTVFVILPSLFCAYSFCQNQKNELSEKTHAKIVYVLMGISVTTSALLSITGGINTQLMGRNLLLFQWLESVLSII